MTIVVITDHPSKQSSPLMAASKMVPVPESLMSPDCPPSVNVTPGHPKVLSNTSTPINRTLTKPNKGNQVNLSNVRTACLTHAR